MNAKSGSPSAGWSPGDIMRDMYTAWRMLWDPRVPSLLKILLPAAALLYWISPIDLLPGLPFDDIALLVLALRLFVQMGSVMGNGPQSAGPGYDPNQRNPSADRPKDDENIVDTTWHVIKD